MLFNSLNSQWLNFNRNALGLFLGSRPRWRWPASIPSWSISSCFQSQTSWLPPWRWCTITSHPKKITKTISADGHQKCTLWRGLKILGPPKWIWKKQCQRWLFFWFPLAPWFWAIAKQYCGRVQSGDNHLGYRNEILQNFKRFDQVPQFHSWNFRKIMNNQICHERSYNFSLLLSLSMPKS